MKNEQTPNDTVRIDAEALIAVMEQIPEDRRAYLNGYAAGMADERKLSAQQASA